jgi:thioredoxin-dependent peroxiredoxin
MKRRLAVRGVLFALIGVFAMAGAAGAIEVGQKAPDFTLAAPDGKQVKLGDLLAKGPVVIYTFIQAFTGT